jgi:FKBP-type peptidyl-prolyl cis-trans isomerase
MKKTISIIIIISIIVVLVFLVSNKKTTRVTEQEIVFPEPISTLPKTESQTVPSTQEKKIVRTININNMNIEIKKEGTGEAIVNGKIAVVHYTGKLTNGTVFDSSIPRGQPFEFPLGQGMVIEGWEKGVLGMKVSEQRTLTIPPEMGYGARGAGALIPPHATLLFEVELLAIK